MSRCLSQTDITRHHQGPKQNITNQTITLNNPWPYGSWRLMTHRAKFPLVRIPLAGEYPQIPSNHPFLKGLIHHESTTPHLCPLRSTPRSRHLIWASAVPSPQVPCAVGSSNPVLQHETVQDKGGPTIQCQGFSGGSPNVLTGRNCDNPSEEIYWHGTWVPTSSCVW